MFQASELIVSERRRDGRTQTLVLGEWEGVCSKLTTTWNYSDVAGAHYAFVAAHGTIAFSFRKLLANRQQFLAPRLGRLGIRHLEVFERIEDDLGDDQPGIPLSSAGTTYQGARSVLVALRHCSYAFM